MEKKGFKDVSANIRNVIKKAKNTSTEDSYAVELLKGTVQKEPAFIDAREALREKEKELTEKLNPVKKFFIGFKTAKLVTKGKMSTKKKPLQAMKLAEEALALNLGCIPALQLLAEAAANADALFISIEALELANEYSPENQTILKKLAEIYKKADRPTDVLRIKQQIAKMHPDDLEAQADLRAAAARATMDNGNWEKEGDFKDKLKNKDESLQMEQDEKIVRSADDIKETINRLEKEIADGDDTVEKRRRLAELYHRGGMYDEAVNQYNKVLEKLGTFDPAIDKSIEKSEVAKFNLAIEQMKEEGKSQEEINDMKNRCYEYRLDKAQNRVKNYPNDIELRYQLALVFWEGGALDKALEQFQLSQKNPHRRLSSIVFLGMCFREKKQYDMSIEQFEKGIADMGTMNKEKMWALYEFGITYEQMEQNDKALACFKDIYSTDINYKDVKQKVEGA